MTDYDKIFPYPLFHAYLIEGRAEDLQNAATELCLRILCPENPPCGKCPICEKVLTGNHTDIKTLEGGAKVKEVRDFLSDLWLSASDGDRKIYIISDIDSLSDYSQNALLLPIEEPPENTFFIILCRSSEKVLATVKSRCRTVVLPSDGGDDTEKDELCRVFLSSLFKNDAASAFSLFEGKKEEREIFGGFVSYMCGYCREKVKKFSNEEKDEETSLYLLLLATAEKWAARCEMNLNMNLTVAGFVSDCRGNIKEWSLTRSASPRAER